MAELRPRTIDALVSIFVTLLVFVLYSTIALHINSTGGFKENDVFFNADVKARLAWLSKHPNVGGRPYNSFSTRHPFWVPVVSIPNKVAHSVTSTLAGVGIPVITRRDAALATTPVVGAVAVAVLFLLFRRLGASRKSSIAVCLFGVSTRFFGRSRCITA